MEKEALLNPVLWSPSEERIKSSKMYKFMLYINEKYNLKLVNFSELHNWSIENQSNFWSSQKEQNHTLNQKIKCPGVNFSQQGVSIMPKTCC